MGALEMIVIATIVIAAAYVGYHQWLDFQDLDESANAHQIMPHTYDIQNNRINADDRKTSFASHITSFDVKTQFTSGELA